MQPCKYCGEEIEFKYIDGQSTPIHINGGWCSGYGTSPPRASKPFGNVISYVNPNARCPECGETVFFVQCPNGGRVFFDDLGWPWPKHPCTDTKRAQTEAVQPVTQTFHKSFRTAGGESLRVFELADLRELPDNLSLKFREVANRSIAFRLSIQVQVLKDHDITAEDFRNAPAFVIRFYPDHRLIEFISGRKSKIDSLKVPKVEASASSG